jgi:membrane protease subunit HflC
VKRTIILTVTAIFLVALLARMMTYTVRFTESAVLTTFGKAGPDALQKDPGLKFKWPDPIQSVTKYDTRTRILRAMSETQQTRDSRQLVIAGYCTWRVSDPLKFFQRFSNAGPAARDHFERAERVINDSLRSALGETSKFTLDELFAPAGKPSRMRDLEGLVLTSIRGGTQEGSKLSDYGVEVQSVGINSIRFPQEVTQAVMESMKQDRARLVKALESRGRSQAQTIQTAAEANATRIEKFAEAYAAEIRQRGDLEAQKFVEKMNEAPQLAVFLKQNEFMKQLLARRTTAIFSTEQAGFEGMSPRAMSGPRTGGVPGVENLMKVGESGRSALTAEPAGEPAPPHSAAEPEPTKVAGSPQAGGQK